jgi:two-component system nitrogen regulation response regulator GlnG
MKQVLAYDWPGNVRQLRSTIRRAVLLADTVIDEQHLRLPRAPDPYEDMATTDAASEEDVPLKDRVRNATVIVERAALTEALRKTGGNKAKAARLLQIDYKTMHIKLKEYGIGR